MSDITTPYLAVPTHAGLLSQWGRPGGCDLVLELLGNRVDHDLQIRRRYPVVAVFACHACGAFLEVSYNALTCWDRRPA